MQFFLQDRAIIALSGVDVVELLQGITTADIRPLAEGKAVFTAMLTPQGKLAHDFFVYPKESGFYLDVADSDADALRKKLKLYKMRSDVQIGEVEAKLTVLCEPEGQTEGLSRFLGARSVVPLTDADDSDAYHAWRITHGIPDAAKDGTDRSFVLDLGYDALDAVAFDKGCYVGQEVTARMHYKDARKRVPYIVRAESGFAEGQNDVLMDDVRIGDVRSHSGDVGFGVCQWREVEKARVQPTTCTGVPVTLSIPEWFAAKYEALSTAA